MPTYDAEQILRMSVAEFKAFKRSVQILCRMGLTYQKAINILIAARYEEMSNREKYKAIS